jgi:signal peptidase I
MICQLFINADESKKDSFNSNFDLNIKDKRDELAKGNVFVPVIGRRFGSFKNFADKRYDMFDKGIYPGVEFTILDFQVGLEDDITLVVKPNYPLIRALERDWPISVKLDEIPFVFTKGMYNAITVLGSILLAVGFYLSAALFSQFFTLSVINSRSMMNTIIPKDIILVEKITPFVKREIFHMAPCEVGDVVFFSEPTRLEQYLQQSNLPPIKKNDLLVKRATEISHESGSKDYCVNVSFLSLFIAYSAYSSNCMPIYCVV